MGATLSYFSKIIGDHQNQILFVGLSAGKTSSLIYKVVEQNRESSLFLPRKNSTAIWNIKSLATAKAAWEKIQFGAAVIEFDVSNRSKVGFNSLSLLASLSKACDEKEVVIVYLKGQSHANSASCCEVISVLNMNTKIGVNWTAETVAQSEGTCFYDGFGAALLIESA
jgi:hypothetical protein